MKSSELIKTLKHIQDTYGDVEVALQNKPKKGKHVEATDNFFIVPEYYGVEGWRCNLRTWPY